MTGAGTAHLDQTATARFAGPSQGNQADGPSQLKPESSLIRERTERSEWSIRE